MNLYIHVPFCAQRCSYCDFYTQTQLGLRVSYLQALKRELAQRSSELAPNEDLDNIYLGGGTPSLLSIEDLEGIFELIHKHYKIAEDAEITLEANPDDITADYAQGLRTLPINRVSMGMQSFQEEDLKFLNRRHNQRQVYEALEYLRTNGISNLSLDLIYGLPGQTEATWQDNLQRIIALDIPHISAYHLIYEEGTALTKMRNLGKVQEVSEEDSLLFFTMLIEALRGAGYEHYEISNFAKAGQYARLNTGYWQDKPYIGVGPSAHSYNGRERSHNIASIRDYSEAWERNERLCEVEYLSPTDRINEYLMTRLRTQWGINIKDYALHFGAEEKARLLRQASPALQRGDLLLTGEVLRLSERGIFTSDSILIELFI